MTGSDDRSAIDLDTVRALLQGWTSASLGTVHGVAGVRSNPYSSRMSSAIVDVRTDVGESVTLLLKRGDSTEKTRAGTPWGAGYEAVVYQELLARIPSYSTPFVGHVTDGTDAWVVLRWIDDAMRVNKHPDPAALVRAASWLGRFQKEATAALVSPYSEAINRYADGVVAAWVDLALANVAPVLAARPDLGSALRGVVPMVQDLLATQETLVHGDFYPSNVLVTGSRVIPVDWEWAGIAAGEIDLASLIDGWPQPMASDCIDVYREARWPDCDVGDVMRRIWAARLYLSVRSLGRRSLRPSDSVAERYLDHVVRALGHLGAQQPGSDVSRGS